MKTDRELLELAARAAGMNNLTEWSDKISDWDSPHYGSAALHQKGACGECLSWNPLTDDGDALRLAVKLTLEIDVCRTGIAVRTPNGIKVLVEAEDNPDAYSATRRAIVRAAAAIGETL